MGELAVQAEGVGKRFRMARDRRTSIKELVVRGRSSQVEEFWAVRDVSLAVPRGSVYGLIGHNGSGKSTLLKVVGGIYRPTAGTLSVAGRVAALIELGAGFHPDMTGRENIRLNGSILGLSRKEVDRATDEIIEFSGIGGFIDEPVKTYSSGMYVRLGFSVAVNVQPDVLLIDEIIAVGDEDFQRRCFDHLYRLRKSGRTIVVVSHSLGLMRSLCDEITWLDHGRALAEGSAETVVDAYLDSVNATDAVAASGAGAGAGDGAGAGRPGSGEVRLRSVEVLDEDGSPVPSCASGAGLRLRVAFDAAEEVASPEFRLAFRSESGTVVAVPSNRLSGDDVACPAGRGCLDYLLDPCPLAPGHYRVDATVLDTSGTQVFDLWQDAVDLVVRPGRGPAIGGLVALGGRFEGVPVPRG